MKFYLQNRITILIIFFFTMATSLYAMTIYIADHSFNPGSTYTLDVENSDTVENVKDKIFYQQSISVEQQYLYFQGVFLQAGYTLMDYSINNGKTIDLYDHDTSLPVSLTEFTALAYGNNVRIRWVTESETDNLGFILEKSITGSGDRQPIASWNTHLELAGQGSKSSRTEYAFIDVNVKANTAYTYRLASVSVSGNIQIEKETEYAGRAAGLPIAFTLDPPYPNPFNSSVKIVYHLDVDSVVGIDVYDIMGRVVTTLLPATRQTAGSYTISWDGADRSGVSVPSGEYIIRINTNDGQITGKVLLLK